MKAVVPRKLKTVPPTLKYLRDLEADGHVLTDAEVLHVNVDKYRTTIHTASGQRFQFVLLCDHATISNHHREIVEYTGYGPEGLANVIYADACTYAKRETLPNSRIRICLSEECLRRVGVAIKQWTLYKFQFEVRPALIGIAYSFEIIVDE